MSVEPGQLISGAKTGVDIWKNRNAILQSARRIYSRLRHGKISIAVFGPGGTGKTTLSKLLTEDFRWQARSTAYKESVDVERVALPGNFACDLLIAPGQERRRPTTWSALYRELGRSKSCGVINVVSWGLHSMGVFNYQEHKLYKQDMTIGDFVHEYAAECRQQELEVIRELAPRMEDVAGKLWMITLVTKQDLWWNERQQVLNHYQGEYDSYVAAIRQKRGDRNFRHEYLSASLVMSNLFTENREILVPTTEGYDETIQLGHLHRLVETINALAKP